LFGVMLANSEPPEVQVSNGILLVLCVIFLPQGVVGALQGLRLKRTPQAAKAAAVKP
jgi:ABC-type branched-subunit amino acid transport system permease subunit